MDGRLKDGDGFTPKRPIGGCPTGKPTLGCPDEAGRVEFKLFEALPSRAGREAVEPVPNPLAVLGLAVRFLSRILSVVGTLANPDVPAFDVDCGTEGGAV